MKNNNVSGGGKAGAEGVREAVYMHVALAPILLFFFFRFCSAFFLSDDGCFRPLFSPRHAEKMFLFAVSQL